MNSRAPHTSVLFTETLDALSIEPNKRYIDATLGAGGHVIGMLKRKATVLAIDQDSDAIRIATERLDKEYPTWKESGRCTLVQANFRHIETIAQSHGFSHVDGILFDLGVSSMQIDTPSRGFSFRFTDALLDLRMDQMHGDTAAQLVNRMTERELYECISLYGEETRAQDIAHAIVLFRQKQPIKTVSDMVSIISSVPSGQSEGMLARVFQALRIEVNDEMGSLKDALVQAERLLVPGGKLVVISFHSLEDRIVKMFLRKNNWTVETKHPVRPGEQEQWENRRSRSAKLRIGTKKRI